MKFIADFHIHSRYSRATSKDLCFETLAESGHIKGVSIIGTGDFTHPGWLSEIEKKLVSDDTGLLRLRGEKSAIRFILSAEISSIYSFGGKTRKIHSLICMPDLESVKKFNARLDKIGNLKSDGRPILGLDARDLLEIALESCDSPLFIPAHIWTPWFSVLGSKSGFDSIEECFRDLSKHIFALETGLSSDPAMNWMVSSLDRYSLVSNSDAHSASKVGREANVFDCAMTYDAIMKALKKEDKDGFAGTIEFFPEEGKYHFDGHRDCKVSLSPAESRKLKGLCPVCKRPLTLGVLYRVYELKDQPEGRKPKGAKPYRSIFSLSEVLGEILDTGPASKKVKAEYDRLISAIGPELTILLETPLKEVEAKGSSILAEALKRMRAGKVNAIPGYDGEFGVISVFAPGELNRP